MSKKRIALGRGLGALLDDAAGGLSQVSKNTTKSSVAEINTVPLNTIEVNPFQPRKHFDQDALKELAHSIEIHGIIQPITVRKLTANQYQLISGERRYHAAALAGLKEMPAYIRLAEDQQMLEMALVENIQRESLNPIEIALSYQRLISETHLKQEALGDRVGKNRSTVSNYLRLLKLPPSIQAAVRDQTLSMGHARALINIENVDTQLYVFERILSENLSVRKTEERVRHVLNSSGKESVRNKKESHAHFFNDVKELQHLKSTLSAHFGTKINIKVDGKKGAMKIPFHSIEELNRILEILKV